MDNKSRIVALLDSISSQSQSALDIYAAKDFKLPVYADERDILNKLVKLDNEVNDILELIEDKEEHHGN